MAEEIKNTGFVDPAKHNAEIAQKLADQDISGHSTAAEFGDAGSSLDKLAEAASKNPPPVEKKDEADDKKDKDTPPGAVTPKVEDKPGDPPAPTAEELAAKKLEEEKAESLKQADKYFKDAPTLPPNASPKSSEAFSQIKIKAAQEISARDTELEKLRKEKSELEEKVKNTVPPETLKELEDHRKWRAQLDIEANPKFKEFDKTVASSQEFIYAQLKKSPAINDEVIAQIKKHGGPEMVNMEKIFASVKDPQIQRMVEAKLADIEMAKFNKENAIKDAKQNIDKYLKEQEESAVKSASAHNEATKQYLGEYLGKLNWLKQQTAPANADDAGKKAVEETNAFVSQTQKALDDALRDDSPEMRAILLTGMAQLLNLQRTHKAATAQIAELQKQITEANDKLAKYTKAGSTRLRESAVAPGTKPPEKKNDADIFTKRAADSLDDIAKGIREERARAVA